MSESDDSSVSEEGTPFQHVRFKSRQQAYGALRGAIVLFLNQALTARFVGVPINVHRNMWNSNGFDMHIHVRANAMHLAAFDETAPEQNANAFADAAPNISNNPVSLVHEMSLILNSFYEHARMGGPCRLSFTDTVCNVEFNTTLTVVRKAP